jgi:transposase-like protein
MKKDVNHRDAHKERHWRDIVKRQGQSGGTVRDFCHGEGVKESAFYWWRRELSRRTVKHGVNEHAYNAARFLPVKVAEDNTANAGGGLEVHLGTRCVLYLKPGFDRQTLIDVLAALEARPC